MTRTPPPGLTDRQLEVWRLLDRGYGVRTIARLLGISTTAVRYRIDAIEPPTGVGAMMNPDISDCRHIAAKSAEPQVRAAIRADYG